MFAVFVTIEIRPEHRDVFITRMKQQAKDSLDKEPNCGIFEVWTSSKRPNVVQLYEVYTDAAAFDAHLLSAHFKSFDETVSPMLVSKEISTFETKLDVD